MQARKTLPNPLGASLRVVAFIAMAILLPACSASGNSGAATEIMPQPTGTTMSIPTKEMMSTPTGMMEVATPETMMSTPTGEMMSTPSGMMEAATPEAMMSTPIGGMMGTAVPETMMGTPTPCHDAKPIRDDGDWHARSYEISPVESDGCCPLV